MMVRRMRFDVWLCMAVAYAVSMVPASMMNSRADARYEAYEEAHTAEAGAVGGIAGEEVFRAQNVEDILSHETFTVVSPGIEYRNRGMGFYGGRTLYALTLPSGEVVAACINGDSVQSLGSDLYSGDNILPVGKAVYEDLAADEGFLEQIETGEKLSRTDFYVDMVGEALLMGKEQFTEMPVMAVQLLTGAVSFAALHMLGSRFGIFPYIIPPRRKREDE